MHTAHRCIPPSHQARAMLPGSPATFMQHPGECGVSPGHLGNAMGECICITGPVSLLTGLQTFSVLPRLVFQNMSLAAGPGPLPRHPPESCLLSISRLLTSCSLVASSCPSISPFSKWVRKILIEHNRRSASESFQKMKGQLWEAPSPTPCPLRAWDQRDIFSDSYVTATTGC